MRLSKNYGSLFCIFCALCFIACDPAQDFAYPDPAGSSLPERIVLDTAYGIDPAQKMDLYLPAGRTTATKVVVMVHGGGWSAGDKADMNSLVAQLRSKWHDCAVANINYRLVNGSTIIHKQQMDDISAAVHFIASNNKNFQLSNQMGMLGASAGAQLALLYAYKYNPGGYVRCVADLYGPCIIDDWAWYNSFNIFFGRSIKDVLTTYNGTTWEADSAVYHANSPYTQLKAGDSPTIIFHGTNDVIVPLYQSQWLHSKLADKKVPNEYYEYLDGHGFNGVNNADCAGKIVSFFQRYLP